MVTKNWAIVVGINEYDNIGHLKYANRDAEAMANFFRGDGFDRVFCFADGLAIPKERDQKSTQPRLTDLLSFLHDRFDLTDRAGNKLPPPLNPGDNLWFFFSGHGKRIGDRDCLLPQDYNPRLPNCETWIPVDFVREALLRSGADNVILLLDACRTEGEKDDGTGIGDKQPGTITVYSCERNKPSYEIESLQHGAFTAALLEGLMMPKSDKNCATVQRLDQHLRDRVPQLCLKHPEKPTQMPSTTVDPGQKWYFLLLPKVATAQDIAALKSEARGAELEEDWDLAEQLWIRFGAVSPGDRSAFEGFTRVQRKKEEGRSAIPNQSQRQVESKIGVRSPQPQPPKPTPPPAKPALPTFTFHSVTLDATGKQIARKPGNATYFSEDLGNGITLDMVKIPGGSFQMGATKSGLLGRKEEGASDNEFPQHRVTVKEFWMGKFVVTQEQWKTIALLPKIKTDLKPDPSYFKGDKLPVEFVSWNQVKEFCNRLSKKTGKTFDLPTEAQWEYACRAGTTTPFHFGETITTDVANFDGNSTYAKASKGIYREKTMPADSFDPNAFGLYNMHGNVWEWCLDPWHKNYDGAPKDDRVWSVSNASGSKLRLLRGGSWIRDPSNCRSANRDDTRFVLGYIDNVGFRVVCLSSRGPS
jgi:formylglycine-generating enzyme required for sulfatase activity/uncharacterized caspase-like protein